jgi:hypothetical protein
MNITSLTYSRSAKVADPNNRYENHDVSLTATIQGEWDNEKQEAIYQELRDWVLKKVRAEVIKIKDGYPF